jgi:hypothetical protein
MVGTRVMIAKKYGTRFPKVSDVRSIVFHEAVYYIILNIRTSPTNREGER